MSRLRERLDAFDLHPRKRLGQNFLHDPRILTAIASSVAQDHPEALIEIGPGPGTLTEHLVGIGCPIWAVEKDERLVELLRHCFADEPRVHIRAADFLGFEPSLDLPPGVVPSVVGNIPYNISSPIISRLLELRGRIGPATLMLQAELAQRLRAPVGARASGSLTVLLALVARVSRVLSVPPGAFFPPPKVDSEVIRIEWRPAPAVEVEDLAAFERTVRAGFAQRRKTLRNALSARWGRAQIGRAERRADVDLGRRAETLDLASWARITRAVAECEATDGR